MLASMSKEDKSPSSTFRFLVHYQRKARGVVVFDYKASVGVRGRLYEARDGRRRADARVMHEADNDGNSDGQA